jgi:hypothetical protein
MAILAAPLREQAPRRGSREYHFVENRYRAKPGSLLVLVDRRQAVRVIPAGT